MAIGRPLTYTDDMPETLVAFMSEGLSLTAAMAAMGFHRQTGYDWADRYPAFSDAVKLGQSKRQLFLERRLLKEELASPQVTGTIFALKNTGTGDWRDKQEVEHSGSLDVSTKEQRDASVAAAARADS